MWGILFWTKDGSHFGNFNMARYCTSSVLVRKSFKSDTDFDFKISISLVFPIYCKQSSAKKWVVVVKIWHQRWKKSSTKDGSHFGNFNMARYCTSSVLVRNSSAVWLLLWICCSRGTSESYAYGKQWICFSN
jgi:hypothetical protein